jgi:hypothetical protein
MIKGSATRLPSLFSHTLLTEESAALGLPDFPVENLAACLQIMSQGCPLHLKYFLCRFFTSIVDPDSLNPDPEKDPDPAFQGIPEPDTARTFQVNPVPDTDPDSGF